MLDLVLLGLEVVVLTACLAAAIAVFGDAGCAEERASTADGAGTRGVVEQNAAARQSGGDQDEVATPRNESNTAAPPRCRWGRGVLLLEHSESQRSTPGAVPAVAWQMRQSDSDCALPNQCVRGESNKFAWWGN